MYAPIPEHKLDHDTIVDCIKYVNETIYCTSNFIRSVTSTGLPRGVFTDSKPNTGIIFPLTSRKKAVSPLDNTDNNG